MEELKVIMLCCSRFAFPAMHLLAYTGQLKVVVIPAHCEDIFNETSQFLQETGIAVFKFSKNEFAPETSKLIKEKEINLGLVLTFSYIIPRLVFELPVKGFYNVHPGALPEYRGADPIFYQIKNREKFAAVAVHKVDDGMDDGDIVSQEKIILEQTDTYGMLETKLAQLALKQISTLTNILALGFALPLKKQDERKARYYGKQELTELTIEWETMEAATVVSLVNACNPHNKGATTKINNKLIRFLSVEENKGGNDTGQAPGTILSIEDDYMEVAAINNDSVRVAYLYIDEGFVTPGHLKKSGLTAKMCFDKTVF